MVESTQIRPESREQLSFAHEDHVHGVAFQNKATEWPRL